ncbi:MAG: hypothetical protein ACLSAP_00325 [Oscillospiraceae bacterium]
MGFACMRRNPIRAQFTTVPRGAASRRDARTLEELRILYVALTR